MILFQPLHHPHPLFGGHVQIDVGQLHPVGSQESVGLDWRLRDEYVDKIRAVTPAQVQAVAAKYFVPDGLTVSYLVPEAKS